MQYLGSEVAPPRSEDLKSKMEIEKPIEANVFTASDLALPSEPKIKEGGRGKQILIYLLVAVLASSLTFGIQALRHFSSASPYDRILALRGGVALTASQLQDLVRSQGLTAYWSGAEAGARYALNAPTDSQVYIRYLPGGNGLIDSQANYRVIGTYLTKNAFLNVQSSGKLSNSVGFTNVEGNSVFYSLSRPLNIYLGMRDSGVEIEIYDPIAGKALQSARKFGVIELVK